MGAIDKEKIYEELRNYHVDAFPEKLSTDSMNNLRAEFGLIEDDVVSMLLQLVNGKSVYADLTSNINEFQGKIGRHSHSDSEKTDREFFVSKSTKLINMMALAKSFAFQLRKVRPPRVVKR